MSGRWKNVAAQLEISVLGGRLHGGEGLAFWYLPVRARCKERQLEWLWAALSHIACCMLRVPHYLACLMHHTIRCMLHVGFPVTRAHRTAAVPQVRRGAARARADVRRGRVV